MLSAIQIYNIKKEKLIDKIFVQNLFMKPYHCNIFANSDCILIKMLCFVQSRGKRFEIYSKIQAGIYQKYCEKLLLLFKMSY